MQTLESLYTASSAICCASPGGQTQAEQKLYMYPRNSPLKDKVPREATACIGKFKATLLHQYQTALEIFAGDVFVTYVYNILCKCYVLFLQALCEAGCCMDITNKYGVTPLYEAALKGKELCCFFFSARLHSTA
jgi:hypothetical protein